MFNFWCQFLIKSAIKITRRSFSWTDATGKSLNDVKGTSSSSRLCQLQHWIIYSEENADDEINTTKISNNGDVILANPFHLEKISFSHQKLSSVKLPIKIKEPNWKLLLQLIRRLCLSSEVWNARLSEASMGTLKKIINFNFLLYSQLPRPSPSSLDFLFCVGFLFLRST